ncbi:unnamed protein product [Blepharisma stoltei]|uniref:non-specific serine/threonine protein kinase n=1 Tax=Blepharisma stoltei TaxID=1481888 RepID=A0AAU9KNT1_9CILI|nr:unnamed protein product [Blepharisma stoltei]
MGKCISVTQASINNYEVIEKIIFWRYGMIYKVRNKTDDNIYAMQEIKLKRLEILGAEKEAKKLSKLSCPYLVNITDTFIHRSKLYLIRDFSNGRPLRELINVRFQPLEESLIWNYLIQICLGIEYLHTNDIEHHDLNPDVVFVHHDDRVKLADYGIHNWFPPAEEGKIPNVNELSYFAPEQYEYRHKKTNDIWALGVILYEMCELKFPFKADDLAEIHRAVTEYDFIATDNEYSEDLLWIIKLCLMKNHKSRPNIQEILTLNIMKRKALELNIKIPKDSILYQELIENQLISSEITNPFEKDYEAINEIVFMKWNSNEIVTWNLETLKSTSKCFDLISNLSFYGSTLIPENKGIFFYGGKLNNREITGKTFIVDSDKNITLMSPGSQTHLIGLAYFKKYIYALGGDPEVSNKFNLEENIWEACPPLPKGDFRNSSLIAYKDHILVAGKYLDKLVSFDINEDNYLVISNLNLEIDKNKVLFTENNRIYIIEIKGKIYESEMNNFMTWKCIGENNILDSDIQSYVVGFRNHFYFILVNNDLVNFDLKKKKLRWFKRLN